MQPFQNCHVTIVICSYNGALRLPETLKHLLVQDVPEDISWEVVVVDNASTDDTARVARSLWPVTFPVPLRVVSEPERGLSNARKRGITEARHELVSFLDDDNWVAPNWVRLVSEIMSAHPEVGACGGRSEAVFDTSPPCWFHNFQHSYAVGPQSAVAGDITWKQAWNDCHLWGAGLTIRKSAWKLLTKSGFTLILSGRRGVSMASGEDYELCNALRLSGWRLWYEPMLTFRHYIPANKLTWKYIKSLYKGFGASNTGIDPYRFLIMKPQQFPKSLFGKYWTWQLLRSVYILFFRHIIKLFLNFPIFCYVGNPMILSIYYEIGKIEALLKQRAEYDFNIIKVHKLSSAFNSNQHQDTSAA